MIGPWWILGLGFIVPVILTLMLAATSKDEFEERGWTLGAIFLLALLFGFAFQVIVS